MTTETDEFLKSIETRVQTIQIELGNEAYLELEYSFHGGVYWLLYFPDGNGTQIENEIATALIAAVNGNKTSLAFGEYELSEDEVEELKNMAE